MLQVGMFRPLSMLLVLSCLTIGASSCVEPPPPPPAPAPAPPVLAAKMREVPVAMYMTQWCPHCRRARAWLRRGGYNFVELDVERDQRAAAILRAVNPRGSVPVFDVDGLIVIGFEPAMLHGALRQAASGRGAQERPAY